MSVKLRYRRKVSFRILAGGFARRKAEKAQKNVLYKEYREVRSGFSL